MSDLTPVADVDNHAQAFEDSVVYAFGLPTGSTLTCKVFPGVDVDGNITGIVRSAAAPIPASNTGPGWRSRDTTNGDEFMMMCNDGYLRIYRNDGSQATPTWTEVNKMNLADGKWDIGATTGGYTGCMVYDIFNTSYDFRAGGFIEWATEAFDDTDYFSTSYRTRLTLPATGRYRFYWSAFIGSPGDPDYFNNTSIYCGLRRNGSDWEFDANQGSGTKNLIDDSRPGVGVRGHYIQEYSVDDYFEVYAYTEGGNDYAGEIHMGHFQVERIN
jgi:hypothetical protein